MTTVTHPLTEVDYPLVMSARQAGESVGLDEHRIVRMCEAGEIDHAPHEPFGRWQVYTIPLWRKLGILPIDHLDVGHVAV